MPANNVRGRSGAEDLDEIEKSMVIIGHANGMNTDQIAAEIEELTGKRRRDPSTIRKFLKRWQQNPTIKATARPGRPAKTLSSVDKEIIGAAKRDPFATSQAIANEINERHPGLDISRRLVDPRLAEVRLFRRVAAIKPTLSDENRRYRLCWAKEHVNWTLEMWKRVLWTDESSFYIHYNGKLYVWRHAHMHYQHHLMKKTWKKEGEFLFDATLINPHDCS